MDGHNIEITFPTGVFNEGVDHIDYSQDALIEVDHFVQSWLSIEDLSHER